MIHQSEFDAANVALSRAADKRKSFINIHKKTVYHHLNSAKSMPATLQSRPADVVNIIFLGFNTTACIFYTTACILATV